MIEAATTVVRPAAGPETDICELLINPITMPPIIPAIIPESGGAPEANAMPKHRGNATKKTTIPEGRFCFKSAKIFFDFSESNNNMIYKLLRAHKHGGGLTPSANLRSEEIL